MVVLDVAEGSLGLEHCEFLRQLSEVVSDGWGFAGDLIERRTSFFGLQGLSWSFGFPGTGLLCVLERERERERDRWMAWGEEGMK